jgi:uncharacterized protein (TIGR02646 family)
MKRIIKIAEPQSLIRHRANQPAYYEGLSIIAKEELRSNLLSEQGHICCYCMKRIPEKIDANGNVSYDMKVEHFQCQDKHPLLQLVYSNLLGACTGNEGKPKKLQTCDTRKGNEDLTISPTSTAPNCEFLFKYNSEGEISSVDNDENINRQLNSILNLNMQTLKDARSEIYLEVQRKVKIEGTRLKNDKAGFNRFLVKERNYWLNRTDNKFRQYNMVAVYYLEKKISRNQD